MLIVIADYKGYQDRGNVVRNVYDFGSSCGTTASIVHYTIDLIPWV